MAARPVRPSVLTSYGQPYWGWKRWATVRRDLRQAAAYRDATRMRWEKAVLTGQSRPDLEDTARDAEAAYWRIDHYARRYRAFTEMPK